MQHLMLYGAYQQPLTGWYPFVGFLAFDPTSGLFDGNIVDVFGNAAVQGTKSDASVDFDKVYDTETDAGFVYTTRDKIRYNLNPKEDGIQWDGGYTLNNGESGIVYCTIRPYEPTERDMMSEAFVRAGEFLQGRIIASQN